MLPHHHHSFIDECRARLVAAKKALFDEFPDKHYHPREGRFLAVTHVIFPNHQKIAGIIMDFTLSKDTPSLRIVVQPLDADKNILPEIDTVTQHPTLQVDSLVLTGDDNVAVVPDPNDPKVFVVSRKNNTFSGQGSLSAEAKNDEGDTINGTQLVTVIADPIVDTGIAKSLGFALAPDASQPPAQDGTVAQG